MVVFLNQEAFQELIQRLPERVAKLEEAQDRTDDWQSRQNGSLSKLGDEVKLLREDMHTKFDELKDLIQQNNDKRDLNIRQRVTWIVGLILGIPSTIWAFVQLISFLSQK